MSCPATGQFTLVVIFRVWSLYCKLWTQGRGITQNGTQAHFRAHTQTDNLINLFHLSIFQEETGGSRMTLQGEHTDSTAMKPWHRQIPRCQATVPPRHASIVRFWKNGLSKSGCFSCIGVMGVFCKYCGNKNEVRSKRLFLCTTRPEDETARTWGEGAGCSPHMIPRYKSTLMQWSRILGCTQARWSVPGRSTFWHPKCS